MTDDELREARRATLSNNTDELQRLGQVAVDRLVSLPETDPEGFQALIDEMSPEHRKMIRQDRKSGEWRLNSVPGMPEISFGTAVRMGIIRF